MAQVIYITFPNLTVNGTQTFPLVEDVQIALENTYESMGSLCGGISESVGQFNTATTLISGNLTSGGATLENIMNYPMWRNTAPVKLSAKLLFYIGQNETKTGGKYDVIDHMNMFIERATLTRLDKGGFSVPGLSVGSIIQESINEEGGGTRTQQIKSKLLDIHIPGIVKLDNAYIVSISPIYSRQKDIDGYPIWGSLEIQFSGLVPAIYEDNFKDVETYSSTSIQGLF